MHIVLKLIVHRLRSGTVEVPMLTLRRCDGLVVSVPASRPPVPGSNLGPGLPTVRSEGRQIVTIILYQQCKKIYASVDRKLFFNLFWLYKKNRFYLPQQLGITKISQIYFLNVPHSKGWPLVYLVLLSCRAVGHEQWAVWPTWPTWSLENKNYHSK